MWIYDVEYEGAEQGEGVLAASGPVAFQRHSAGDLKRAERGEDNESESESGNVDATRWLAAASVHLCHEWLSWTQASVLARLPATGSAARHGERLRRADTRVILIKTLNRDASACVRPDAPRCNLSGAQAL
ncbi:unnamed protein product [Gadus morhua 'NCC']